MTEGCCALSCGLGGVQHIPMDSSVQVTQCAVGVTKGCPILDAGNGKKIQTVSDAGNWSAKPC